MIRAQEQVDAIKKLGEKQPGKLNVLVRSVEEVKSEGDAKGILEEVRPDWVVWSAGRFDIFLMGFEKSSLDEPLESLDGSLL